MHIFAFFMNYKVIIFKHVEGAEVKVTLKGMFALVIAVAKSDWGPAPHCNCRIYMLIQANNLPSRFYCAYCYTIHQESFVKRQFQKATSFFHQLNDEAKDH